MEFNTITITRIIEQPNEVKTFEFKPSIPFTFLPGQFITLEFNIHNRIVRRSYSLHSAPYSNEPSAFSVKRIENGEVSRIMVDTIRPGDQLKAINPTGQFVYIPQTILPRDLIFLAAGTGITPILSMIQSALTLEKNANLLLIYSNRDAASTLFLNELDNLTAQYPNQFQIVNLFSNNKELSKARLNKELLQLLVESNVRFDQTKAQFFTCGPYDYMQLCKITLLSMGYQQEQLFKETFFIPEPDGDDDDESDMDVVKDTTTYSVNLQFKGNTYSLEVPYNQTLLDAGLNHGITLPYSCKSGMCGTCAANCEKGKIRMEYNEVLTDKEVLRGRFLMCTAHPISEGVLIDA